MLVKYLQLINAFEVIEAGIPRRVSSKFVLKDYHSPASLRSRVAEKIMTGAILNC